MLILGRVPSNRFIRRFPLSVSQQVHKLTIRCNRTQ